MSDFFSLDFFFKLFASVLGTVGFAILFNVRPRHLLIAGIGGLATFAVYYSCAFFGVSLFVCAFASAAFAALFSEIFARIKKAPTAIFLIPAGIPIVPGGDLYYTMRFLLEGQYNDATGYLLSACKIGIGIAGGIVAVSVIWGLVFNGHFKNLKNRKKAQKSNTEQ